MTHPKLIIADEATSMLDYDNKIEINNLLNRLKDKFGLSIIAIIHDVDFNYNSWDKIAVLNNRMLVDFMEFKDFFKYALSDYANELIDSHRYFYG